MPSTLEILHAEVMCLSRSDRARLLDRLVASLDADASAEVAWDELADERALELDSGVIDAHPLEVVVARLEARFPG